MAMFNTLIFVSTVLAAVATAADCAPPNAVHLIVCRGAETTVQGFGISKAIVNSVQRMIPNTTAEAVVYPATPNLPGSVNEGIVNMTNQIHEYVRACPDSRIVLSGYSEGAVVTGDTVTGGGTQLPYGGKTIASPPLPDDIMNKVAAVVLIGDVVRARSQLYDRWPNGCTVGSMYPRSAGTIAKLDKYADKVGQFCMTGDDVCCATGDSFLVHLGYFNATNADFIARFITSRVHNTTASYS